LTPKRVVEAVACLASRGDRPHDALASCGFGEDDEVFIRIAQPELAVASVRIDVHVGHNLGVRFAGTLNDAVEVVGLKPHRDAIAKRSVRIGDGPVVVRDLASVELQHNRTID
jgi:hypothetical protein